MRHVEAAAGPAAQHRPRMHFDLPRAREQGPRILRVHRQPGTAGLVVDEEDAVPVLAAVGRAEHAPFLLRPGDSADGAGEDDVRVRRMYEDAADTAGFVEPGAR